ncbi:MAG: 2-C-methyl-D-erythritol 2,4-cyclodiphosphate synthase [Gammaproteobacteria bacterium]|nr:2-C-methyl-D-erythritol 2,4-cyclodiphosphate synthase [Gammaproteobacteria bacterium]MDE0411605.1 2-C-methyl-D-erythritol 2,4-cyclodiphosphate synthase [Gammaproteobacteria bacterium]
MMTVRVGFGYDTHGFCEGDHIVIGGERIRFSHGIDAHSDGDVLLHAICDAVLGAAGLGDIGQHFPDSQSRYRDVESTRLLEDVMQKIEDRYWVGNVDCTVVLERPKLAGYIDAMKSNIGRILKISASQVNLKATTSEGMGFIGRGEGVAAFAVVLLQQHSPAGS